MKALIILIFISLIFFTPQISKAQINVEAIYPNASTKLYMVNLEISGMKYVVKSTTAGNRFLKFYNLNHSLWKTIDCNPFPTTAFPLTGTNYDFSALYITETLFDCDSLIEILYVSATGNSDWVSAVYNENGVNLLIADSCGPLIETKIPQQQRPIYNTPLGTKLILSHINGSAIVYDLPCSLTTNLSLIENNLNQNLKIYPNPSKGKTTIEYVIPEAYNQAEIIIYDLLGNEIKRYQIDKSFSNLIIEKNEIPSGTYIYSLSAGGKSINSKKIILVN